MLHPASHLELTKDIYHKRYILSSREIYVVYTLDSRYLAVEYNIY